MKTVNGKLAVQPYIMESLQTEKVNAFARVRQASRIVGLKMLAEGTVDGEVYPAGTTVFLTERSLNEEPWAKQTLRIKNDIGDDVEVMMIDSKFVVGVN